jgi:hypothetical protein
MGRTAAIFACMDGGIGMGPPPLEPRLSSDATGRAFGIPGVERAFGTAAGRWRGESFTSAIVAEDYEEERADRRTDIGTSARHLPLPPSPPPSPSRHPTWQTQPSAPGSLPRSTTSTSHTTLQQSATTFATLTSLRTPLRCTDRLLLHRLFSSSCSTASEVSLALKTIRQLSM